MELLFDPVRSDMELLFDPVRGLPERVLDISDGYRERPDIVGQIEEAYERHNQDSAALEAV